MISFNVVGTPAPQGSKSYRGQSKAGRAILTESSKLVAPWRQDVVAAAQQAYQGDPLDGPLEVTLIFDLRMPASRPKRLRESGWCWSTTKPDLDKIVRATLDALVTAGIIVDDARVCSLIAQKREVVGATGCSVKVVPL